MSNLPLDTSQNSQEVRTFFDKFFLGQITFPSNQIDAVLGFFIKRGFGEQAARSTGIVLLNQAKLDGINIFEILDNLKSLNDAQLSQVITEVLNYYRVQTSVLGYKVSNNSNTFENRNILV
jgi:hypothetical protein